MKPCTPLLAVVSAFTLTCFAATPPPEQLLSSDTLAVVTFPDYAKAKSQTGQTPMSLLVNDPAMKPFKDKFLSKLKSDLLEPLEKEFGIQFSDYSGLAQGQITLALTQNGWDGKSDAKPAFLFLIDVRDKAEALKSNLATLKKKWVDSGKQIRTDKIRDVEFTTLLFNTDDLTKTIDKIFPDPMEGMERLDAKPVKPKKPGKKIEWLLGQSDSLMILGSSAKDIEKLLIRQSGGTVPSLKEQPVFAARYDAEFRDALGYGWVNLKTIMENFTQQAAAKSADNPNRNSSTPPADKIFAVLGLNGINGLSFSTRETPEGNMVNLALSVPEASRKGLTKLVTFDPKDATPPPFVPAEAVKFSRCRFDLQKAVATIEAMLTEAVPQYAGILKSVIDMAGKDKDPNFDLRKQLIGNLGDDLISFEKSPRKQTLADLNSPPSLFLLSSSKAEQLASALKALVSLMPMQAAKVKEREFLGRTVYSMGLPPMPAPGGGKPLERVLSFAASGGYVAMSADVAMLEEYLRSSAGSGKSLRDLPGLARAADKVGGMSTGVFGFENQAETMRSMLEILKKESGTIANLLSASPLGARLGLSEDKNKLKEWLDFSLLPSFDKIGKYFYILVWSGSVTPDGLSLKMFSPYPPQFRK